MGDLSARNFGLLIAYLIPGFVTLCGVGAVLPVAQSWLVGPTAPSVGGFLYVTLASIAAGMTASAVRWATLDSFHAMTGLARPAWDDSKLDQKLSAFEYLVENHYRYYQFYGNSFVALLFAYVVWRWSPEGWAMPWGWVDAGMVFIEGVFFAGSRDALRRYYEGASFVLGIKESEKNCDQRTSPSAGRGGNEANGEFQGE